jgi:hypothetical protein
VIELENKKAIHEALNDIQATEPVAQAKKEDDKKSV